MAAYALDDAPPPEVYTPAWAIEKTLEIRKKEAKDTKEYEARCAQRKVHQELLASFLLSVMVERGEEQIKTSAGTAYKSPQMRCTMTDRKAVIESVLASLTELQHTCDTEDEFLLKAAPLFDVFTNHISKDWVRQQLDANINPDGIEIRRFIDVNVRKA